VEIKPKESRTFTVKGFDQYGKEIEIGTVNWKATGGNIASDGTFITGDKDGNFTVTATVQNISGSASVTVVEPPKLKSLVVSPPQVEMKPDQLPSFTVRGSDQCASESEIDTDDGEIDTEEDDTDDGEIDTEEDDTDDGEIDTEEDDTDDGGNGDDTAPQPRSHTKRKTFVADRDQQILQLAVELLDVCPNRYRLVINVTHRARQIFYQSHNTTEKTAVLRAIKEMAEELSQPEIIDD
jgi:DNA-directed RNA polymerase subunit K/omega